MGLIVSSGPRLRDDAPFCAPAAAGRGRQAGPCGPQAAPDVAVSSAPHRLARGAELRPAPIACLQGLWLMLETSTLSDD